MIKMLFILGKVSSHAKTYLIFIIKQGDLLFLL